MTSYTFRAEADCNLRTIFSSFHLAIVDFHRAGLPGRKARKNHILQSASVVFVLAQDTGSVHWGWLLLSIVRMRFSSSLIRCAWTHGYLSRSALYRFSRTNLLSCAFLLRFPASLIAVMSSHCSLLNGSVQLLNTGLKFGDATHGLLY